MNNVGVNSELGRYYVSGEAHGPDLEAREGTGGPGTTSNLTLTSFNFRQSEGPATLTPGGVFIAVPTPLLVFSIADFLEFHERLTFAATSKAIYTVLNSGSSNPLYHLFFVRLAARRDLGSRQGGLDMHTSSQALQQSLVLANRELDKIKDGIKADREWRKTQGAFVEALKVRVCKTQKSLNAHPREVIYLSPAAQLAAELGQRDAAAKILSWTLAMYPKDKFARRQLGELLLQMRLPDQAIEHATMLVRPAHQETRKRLDLADQEAQVRLTIARALLFQGDSVAALAELNRAPLVNDLLTLSMVQYSCGNKIASDEALSLYMRKIDPSNMDGRLAEVYAWRNEPELAIDCMKKVMHRNLHDKGLWHVANSPFMDPTFNDAVWGPKLLHELREMSASPEQLSALPVIHLPSEDSPKTAASAQA